MINNGITLDEAAAGISLSDGTAEMQACFNNMGESNQRLNAMYANDKEREEEKEKEKQKEDNELTDEEKLALFLRYSPVIPGAFPFLFLINPFLMAEAIIIDGGLQFLNAEVGGGGIICFGWQRNWTIICDW